MLMAHHPSPPYHGSSAIENLAHTILEHAVLQNASDIHLEPFEYSYRIRLRTPSGMVELPAPGEIKIFPALVRHIKLLARLDIALESLPQDGKFAIKLGGEMVEFRLSCLPTIYGTSVVLRVLDQNRTPLDIDSLGFAPQVAAQLRRALQLPFGMVAVTGPTGCGKTTTLYAALRHLSQVDNIKILSVEDPIEYALPGVQQVAVGPLLSFSDALRAFLRHDPDVIFVGEIRDRATARLAIQAALTGHLILTSLHTASAQGVYSRLVDLGVAPYLIDSALKFVLAQTLHSDSQTNTRYPTGTPYWHQPQHHG